MSSTMSFRSVCLAALLSVSFALGAGCDTTSRCQTGAGGAAGNAGAGGATGCTAPASTACIQPAPSFANTITPILDRSCNTCHSDGNPDGIWPLRAYSDVAAWSQLITMDLVTCSMPPADSGVPFPDSDRQLLFAWLACGSPDN